MAAHREMLDLCLCGLRPRVALQRDIAARLVESAASAERRERAGPSL